MEGRYNIVTGGSGFIGSHIVEELLDRGKNVIIIAPSMPLWLNAGYLKDKRVIYLHGSSTNLNRYITAIKNYDIEAIYDVGGILGTEELSYRFEDAVHFNVLGSKNSLEMARLLDVPIFFPMKEGEWVDGYSITKKAILTLYEFYRKTYNLKTVVATWYHAYGERQKICPVRKAVPTFIAQAMTGRPITIQGSPEKALDLIYVKDLAKLVVDLMESDKTDYDLVYEIGYGKQVTIKDLAEMIIKSVSEKYVDYNIYQDKVSDIVVKEEFRKTLPKQPFKAADLSNIEKVLGKVKFTDIENGIRKTVEWYFREYHQRLEYLNRCLDMFDHRDEVGV